MLIVCPSCASEYEIDVERVGPGGRSVRCAACREAWFISPDEVSAALEAEMSAALLDAAGPGAADARAAAQTDLDAWEAALAGPDSDNPPAPPQNEPEANPEAPRRRPGPKARKAPPPRTGMRRAAVVAVSAMGLLALALTGRSTVVRAMPQSAGLYARIGLPVNLRGVELRDVVAFQTQGDGAQGQLVVEGDLVGLRADGVVVPPLEIEVRDGRDQPLYRWRLAPPRETLDLRETARFRASLSAPPAQGRAVQVRFAAEAGGGDPRAGDAKTGATAGHP